MYISYFLFETNNWGCPRPQCPHYIDEGTEAWHLCLHNSDRHWSYSQSLLGEKLSSVERVEPVLSNINVNPVHLSCDEGIRPRDICSTPCILLQFLFVRRNQLKCLLSSFIESLSVMTLLSLSTDLWLFP